MQAFAESSAPAPKTITRQKLTERWLEVISAIMLGLVAVATAWSGYQGARWGGLQTMKYSQATAKRVESTRAGTLAGQDRLFDVSLFDQWLDATYHDETALANAYEKRFRPEFRPAFEAWLATDPFRNTSAPPGPLYMPEYVSADAARSEDLEKQATAMFEAGQQANETGDQYVLNTVFLASALFLAGIAGRFEWRAARIAILVTSAAALGVGILNMIRLPVN